MVQQKLRQAEAHQIILEAWRLLCQPEYYCRQWSVVEGVGFVDFRPSQDQQAGDLIVAPHAGHQQGSLLVVLCLHVDIDPFVSEEVTGNFLEPFVKGQVPKWAQYMRGVTTSSM